MGSTQINLIRGEGGRLAGIMRLEEMLRRVAWISLGLIFASSIGIGFSYLVANNILKKREESNVRLSRSINAQSAKEGLILSLVDRTHIASRALSAAKPWGKLFTLLTQAAPESAYRTVGIDDTSLVTSTLELGSLDDAVNVVSNIITLANDRLLRSPQMQSFSMQENGNIQMTISFHPIL